ncbi:MAG: hypothetical protein AVDCRST_MAG04-3739, partial [uncultured Acetobacteraceae bacterium]
ARTCSGAPQRQHLALDRRPRPGWCGHRGVGLGHTRGLPLHGRRPLHHHGRQPCGPRGPPHGGRSRPGRPRGRWPSWRRRYDGL